MKAITLEPSVMQFAQVHDTAIAIALIFAFAGAVFFAPKVTK